MILGVAQCWSPPPQLWDVVENRGFSCSRRGGRDVKEVFTNAGLLFESSAGTKTEVRQGSFCSLTADGHRINAVKSQSFRMINSSGWLMCIIEEQSRSHISEWILFSFSLKVVLVEIGLVFGFNEPLTNQGLSRGWCMGGPCRCAVFGSGCQLPDSGSSKTGPDHHVHIWCHTLINYPFLGLLHKRLTKILPDEVKSSNFHSLVQISVFLSSGARQSVAFETSFKLVISRPPPKKSDFISVI